MANVIATILAGGQGKRMGVLCYHRPKPLLPFGGTHRVIDFALSNCLHSGIESVDILTDFQRSGVSSYVRRWQDGQSKQQISLIEARTHYSGTADAVYQNLDKLKASGADNVLVLAADHVYQMDYRPMLAFHEKTMADATVGVISMPQEEARRFGAVAMDSTNRIHDFAEKAEVPASNLISMGIYVFRIEALSEMLSEDAKHPLSLHDFGYCILPSMVRHNRVHGFPFDGYWRDIGTIEAYYKANMEAVRQRHDRNLAGDWPVVSALNSLPESRVSPQARVYKSIVGRGCHIMGYVENSVIGDGVCVEENVVIRNSVIMDSVFVGERSILQSCIIDEGVSIGPWCEIGANDHLLLRSGIAVIGKDAPRRSQGSGQDDTGFPEIESSLLAS